VKGSGWTNGLLIDILSISPALYLSSSWFLVRKSTIDKVMLRQALGFESVGQISALI